MVALVSLKFIAVQRFLLFAHIHSLALIEIPEAAAAAPVNCSLLVNTRNGRSLNSKEAAQGPLLSLI
ncbi:hypothetical protein D3C75_1214770 [compost metagenome]